jgi:hypothetical protein
LGTGRSTRRGATGEAVVEVGDGADVDAEAAGVLDEAEDEGKVGGDGENDLVDEELAGAAEEVIEGTGDVVAAGCGVVGGSDDKAFGAETVALKGKQVVAQRVATRPEPTMRMLRVSMPAR